MAMLSMIVVSACSGPDSSAIPFTDAQSLPRNTTIDCGHLSSTACTVSPVRNVARDACAQLRACLESGWAGDKKVARVIGCEAPTTYAVNGRIPVAAISAELDLDGIPAHGSYLLSKTEEGWCPADVLLEPDWTHGGYCEAEIRFDWVSAAATGSENELSVVAKRACHMSLDQAEIAAGESDLASEACVHSQFRWVDKRLQKTHPLGQEDGCQEP